MTTGESYDRCEDYVRARAGWLVRCAYLLTGDREQALDLAQDTSARVFRSWEQVERAEDQDAYVARTMLNALRSARRRPRPALVPLEERPDVGEVDTALRGVDDTDAVLRALQVLSERERAAVVLRYWSDQDARSIGVALQCGESTVRSLLTRAIARLKTELGEDDL